MAAWHLYLASASPRRLELLRRVGIEPTVMPSGVDEAQTEGESPAEHVRRLAVAKARAAASRLPPGAARGVVLAADTAVTIDGEVLGKPHDVAQARRMLERLRDRRHEVLTGVCLRRTDDGREVAAVDSTRVVFRGYGERLLAAYLASGEPMDKAGAYGIQGRGALLARRIEGSWSNVVGLPVERLPELLETIDLDWLELAGG